MNLAVHGLAGDIRQGNSYYEDLHSSVGKFDFVMANPPFNVDRVDKERLKDDKARFPLGMPTVDNANYLWIQLFYSALNKTGRAGFVMANSAADARGSELEIRKKLLRAGVVDAIVSIDSNFFYTVTLPCTLWFLDNGKRGTKRKDKVLFLDARGLYNQLDRAHREFAPEHLAFLANIARLYRGEKPENPPAVVEGANGLRFGWKKLFPKGKYADVPGLCKVATLADIKEQGHSLNPGRYVGVADGDEDEGDFRETFVALNKELAKLNRQAHKLEKQIAQNAKGVLEVVE